MSRQKDKGTRLETAVVTYLRAMSDDTEETIHREILHGAQDHGDITGLYIHGQRVALEIKNHNRLDLAGWLDQAVEEAGNIDSPYPFVVFHRRGVGLTVQTMGDQYVLTNLRTLARIANHGEIREES